MNDLEWLFRDKIRFRPGILESERLNVKNSLVQPLRFRGVLCIARSVSQPRQTCTGSTAVPELLVTALY